MGELFVFSRFDPSGASSRIRLYAVKEYFQDEGITVHYIPLLPTPYLQRRYAGQRISPLWIARRMIHRWRRLRHVLRSGTPWIWVQHELFPWIPAVLERWVFRRARVVLDFDDAIFHRYDQHPKWIVRMTLGEKIANLMKKAWAVTACNAYLEAYARHHGASRVYRYPSSVDLRRYKPRPSERFSGETIMVGWLGSPSTSVYLLDLLEVMRALKEFPIRWLFIGADPSIRARFAGLPVEFAEWSLEQEVDLLHRMDVGIMPLPDIPWTRGKCGYKLIQYMAVGIPIVASPVGINRELALPGRTGFAPQTAREWVEALRVLAGSPELRVRMGREGRKIVEERFDLERNGQRLAEMFREWMTSDETIPG